MWVPSSLVKLVETLKKLPGVGTRTAERLAFFLLREPLVLEDLEHALHQARENLTFCSVCHGITERGQDPCPLCTDPRRNTGQLCVVERPQDVFLLERLGVFQGRYHVLGGALSPVDGIGPEQLHLQDLRERVQREGIQEVILALNPTVEGDATAHYVLQLLADLPVKVTRIARGLPAGADLSFSDVTTLRDAFEGRTEF